MGADVRDIEQIKSKVERILSQEEQERIDNDEPVSQFKQEKLEREALKNWDLFYKRNGTRFFKDRHWTTREFYELAVNCSPGEYSQESAVTKQVKILEIGSGVGNAVFPLLEENENIFIFACDFSPRAIQFIKENPLYNPKRCLAFQCDVTVDDLSENVPSNTIDAVTMIFVLSAIVPSKMPSVIKNISKVLRPGGIVLLRDYGIYDHAMLRFAKGHKLEDNFYVRQDGTRAFFFSLDFLYQLFSVEGFEIETNEFVHRSTVNKKEGIDVPRIFVQGRFRKKSKAT